MEISKGLLDPVIKDHRSNSLRVMNVKINADACLILIQDSRITITRVLNIIFSREWILYPCVRKRKEYFKFLSIWKKSKNE